MVRQNARRVVVLEKLPQHAQLAMELVSVIVGFVMMDVSFWEEVAHVVIWLLEIVTNGNMELAQNVMAQEMEHRGVQLVLELGNKNVQPVMGQEQKECGIVMTVVFLRVDCVHVVI